MSDHLDYDEIRRRVNKRVNKRKELYIHTGVYVVVNIAVLLVWLVLRGGAFGLTAQDPEFAQIISAPIPLLLAGAWMIGLAIHAMTVFFETGMLERMQDREMTREIEREKQRLHLSEKPKREALTLSDDGELVPTAEVAERTARRVGRREQ